MVALLKHIMTYTYKPLIENYLSKTRYYRGFGSSIEVPAGVFHPGLFYSTKWLLEHIQSFDLENKSVLELGAGSGLIAVTVAKKGAISTAVDINHGSIRAITSNARRNNVSVEVIHSDLFEAIPGRMFDHIIINPPFYKKDPVTFEEHAWYCGSDSNYFTRLFQALKEHTHAQTVVSMILSDACDIDQIEQLAHKHNWQLHLVITRKNFLEQNFIYHIKPTNERFE